MIKSTIAMLTLTAALVAGCARTADPVENASTSTWHRDLTRFTDARNDVFERILVATNSRGDTATPCRDLRTITLEAQKQPAGPDSALNRLLPPLYDAELKYVDACLAGDWDTAQRHLSEATSYSSLIGKRYDEISR